MSDLILSLVELNSLKKVMQICLEILQEDEILQENIECNDDTEVHIRTYKYDLCKIYCDFRTKSYDNFHLVSQFLAENGYGYDKLERTMCIAIKIIGQNYRLGEKIATFLESKKVKVKRLVIMGESSSALTRKVHSFSDEIENLDDFMDGFVTQKELGEIYGKSAVAVGKGLIEVGLKDPEDKSPTSLAREEGMVIFMPLKNANAVNIRWSEKMACYELDRLGWKREIQDFDDLF
jgi:hypothetical protein